MERHAGAIAPHAIAVRAVLLLLRRTLSPAYILPTVGLIVVAIGATQTATWGIGCAMLLVPSMQQRRLIEMLVTRVVVKDRHCTMVVQPLVVGDNIIGGVSPLDVPRSARDGQGSAMANERGALIGIGRVSGVAHWQFPTEVPVESRGFDVHLAKDALFLGGVLHVDVVADFGLEVRGHLGTATEQLPLGPLAQVAPLEAHRRELVFRQAQQFGHLLAIRTRYRSVEAYYHRSGSSPKSPC